MTSGINVLMVEDDADCAESLRKVLEARTDASYHVEIVRTLHDALERLKSGGIDAVTLDLSLPDVPGFLDVIKYIPCMSKDVAVVVLTAWGANIQELAKAAGADECLTKPADPTEVNKVLQYAIIHRRANKNWHEIEKPLAQLGTLAARLSEMACEDDTCPNRKSTCQ